MNDYIKKYRNNQLTPAELSQLKQRLEEMTDDELSQCLKNDWETAAVDVALTDGRRLDHLKSMLDSEISANGGSIATTGCGKSTRVFSHLLKYAAIMLIPLLTAAAIYFYCESSSQHSADMAVATGKGESASVSLPDGSRVTLYYESKLSYSPHSFNKRRREVSFDGDAHFEVHADSHNPFVIASKALTVTVVGTTFSLSARQGADTAELYLEQGRVSLRSPLSDEAVTMVPNERASVNCLTGKITIERPTDKPLTRHDGYLSFDKAPLSKVINTLMSNFDCEIRILDKSLLEKTFSGALSAKSIDEALEVLCLSYDTKAARKGSAYVIGCESGTRR